MRVSSVGEIAGLDVWEHGNSAYPEFGVSEEGTVPKSVEPLANLSDASVRLQRLSYRTTAPGI